jgi:hypothetical protein
MPRVARITAAGCPHYVTQRGNLYNIHALMRLFHFSFVLSYCSGLRFTTMTKVTLRKDINPFNHSMPLGAGFAIKGST